MSSSTAAARYLVAHVGKHCMYRIEEGLVTMPLPPPQAVTSSSSPSIPVISLVPPDSLLSLLCTSALSQILVILSPPSSLPCWKDGVTFVLAHRR
eukprot:761206-Hanusia_phi.AAC.1